MRPEIRKHCAGRQLLVLGEMLSSIGFPQPSKIVCRLANGFDIVGGMENTGLFVPQRTAAAAELQDLWGNARHSQQALLESLGPSGDPELDEEVTSATEAEKERGWPTGPFTCDQLDKALGLWVPARRFGIMQGGRVRVIDDYSENGQNGCVGTHETVSYTHLRAHET